MNTTLKEQSQTWWNEIKQDESKIHDWLRRQYRGEVSASDKILNLKKQYMMGISMKDISTLEVIASQERKHAEWIKELLECRGLPVDEDKANANSRYWSETLPEIDSFEKGCAVGAHAEAMRLARIEVICEDDSAPEDIRNVFSKILKEELFHEKAFRTMAGEAAMESTTYSHELGLKLLGLEP
jgi:tRNA isopentenyl-2-thiomethyl-A-37 hydroxylase MiaE